MQNQITAAGNVAALRVEKIIFSKTSNIAGLILKGIQENPTSMMWIVNKSWLSKKNEMIYYHAAWVIAIDNDKSDKQSNTGKTHLGLA